MRHSSFSRFLFLFLLVIGSLFQAAHAQTPATATFLGIDTVTQGSWQTRYGKQGYKLAVDASPASPASTYGTIVPADHGDYTWSSPTGDLRALVKPTANPPSRIAAQWFSNDIFSVTVSPTDNNPHQVAIYCLDWDGNGMRHQTIEALDVSTSAILSTTTVTGFQQGKYLLWNITGNVKFRVTNLASVNSNATVSAVFLDPALPSWWFTGFPPVLALTAPVNNKGPANIGQAKHMVSQALKALDTAAPTIVTQIRADLATSHPDLLIVPALKPADWVEKQKAPLLLGQLKAISAPFYIRLNTSNPTWLAIERTTNGTNTPNSIFPWTSIPEDDSNKSIATIGQLKAVFSLRFETLALAFVDTDADDLPDSWEASFIAYLAQFGIVFTDVTASDDYDGDGLTHYQEYLSGTDPFIADTDGDGLQDESDPEPLVASVFPTVATFRVLSVFE